MKIKHLAYVVLSIFLALLIVPDAFAQDEVVTLRLGLALEPARLADYEDLIAEWNADNPNLQVTIENTPWSEYWPRMQTLTASNSLPDVWTYVPAFGSQWMESDQLLPIDTFIENDATINIDDFTEVTLDLVRNGEGQLVGLPYDYNGLVLFYNKQLFDEAGIAYPTQDWTFEDMQAASEAIAASVSSEDGPIYGNAMVPMHDWVSDGFYRAFGANFITDEGAVNVNNDGAMAMLNHFVENVENGVTPAPDAGYNNFSMLTVWLDGRAGLAIDGGWSIPTVLEGADFEWDFVPMPFGTDEVRAGVGLGGGYVISRSTEYPEEAYEFLKFLTSTETLNRVVTETGSGVPPRISAQEGLSPEFARYAEIIGGYPAFNGVVGALELFDLQRAVYEELWLGGLTVEEAVSQIEEEGNAILSRAADEL